MSFSAISTEEQGLSINSIQTPWKIENDVEWIKLSSKSGTSGATVGVDVNENSSADESRLGVFYVEGDVSDFDYKAAVSVTQGVATPYLSPDKSELNITGATGNYEVAVSSNFSWTASCSDSWLTVMKSENGVVISVSSNETTSYRTATISFFHNLAVVSEQITVRQAPASVTASTESITFNNTASSVELKINSEAAWTAYSNDSWIEISPSTGSAGSSTLKISASENTSISERTGYVIITVGNDQRIQIPVKQKGIYIEVDKSILSFDASGGDQTITISSNTSWIITDCPSWVKLSKTSGSGNATVTITVSDNPNASTRNATISVTQEGMTIGSSIYLEQNGKSFEIYASSLSFSDKAGTQSVNIKTDGTWSAKTDDSWISVNPNSATGSSSLSITVTENTSDDERNGSIAVTMGNTTLYIYVNQKGKYLTISNSLLTSTSKGGTIDITVSTNDSWTAYVDGGASWITLSQTSGEETAKISATISDNPSVNQRSAYVVIATTHDQSVRAQINQSARYLTIDHNAITFFYKGGTSEAITVSTDGTYSVSSKESWLNINKSENTFTVTASENKTGVIRSGVVTVALTDLKEGTYSVSLKVEQMYQGGSFIVNGYDSDKDYDSSDTSQGKVSIDGYGEDKDYDYSNNSGTDFYLSGYGSDNSYDSNGNSSDSNSGNGFNVIGFNDDRDHDSNSNSNGNLSISGYGNDNNYDSNVSNGITISISNYQSDVNRDESSSSTVTISRTGYNEESNQDGNQASSGNITKAGYNNDSNLE
jgi:hypothetical protein